MNKSFLNLLFLASCLFINACSKQKEDLLLTDKNLTSCGTNTSCQYLFTEQADVTIPQLNLSSGEYRVFWHSYNQGPIATQVFIKAPMKAEIQLNDQDILNGKVIFRQICPSCNLINLKPVGGFVKGRNTSPDKRADQTKWLLEAKIYLEAVDQSSIKDTLYIKQYYYPNFIYN